MLYYSVISTSFFEVPTELRLNDAKEAYFDDTLKLKSEYNDYRSIVLVCYDDQITNLDLFSVAIKICFLRIILSQCYRHFKEQNRNEFEESTTV